MASFEDQFNKVSKSLEIKASSKETFEALFSSGTLDVITRDQIPQTVLEHFEGMSSRFISREKYQEGNFNAYYRIVHSDIQGFITYIADQDKTYDYKKPPVLEKNVYFYEVLDGNKVGHGELRYQPEAKEKDEYFKDKPFVGFTRTENDFLQKGFAKRRLLAMGAYSEMQWHLPLYAGDQNKTADKVWKSLVNENLAEEVPTQSKLRKRYRLKLGVSREEPSSL